MGQLDGKVAIITGGGTGIGKGIARAFAGEGASLVLASRNEGNLETTAAELRPGPGKVIAVPTDVTDEAQVVALFEKTLDVFGRLDILVNNSAAFDKGPVEEVTLETWRRVLDVTLTGAFLGTREAMKIMKRQRAGRIINIGSISAQMPRMDSAPYTAAKHGLVGLTHSTALEGRAFGIAVSCLHPGNTLTEARTDTSRAMNREPMINTEDIAKAALTMAALPPNVNMYEAIVLPVEQHYLGRG